MADDLNRPYIGYRSAGRRPESQQDRRSAADAPLSAIRGMVSGVLGAPGDIESLIRMLPGLSEQTVLPTSEDVEKRLPMRELNQTPTGKAFTTAGQLGGGFYAGPGSPLRAIAGLPSAVSRAGRDFLMSTSPVHVVKPKGGNWLAGSVERAIKPVRARFDMGAGLRVDPATINREGLDARQLEMLAPTDAMNRWLETKLGKYMRDEMATPEDPLRLMADAWPAKRDAQLATKQAKVDKLLAKREAADPRAYPMIDRDIGLVQDEMATIRNYSPLHSEITPTGYNVARARKEAGFPEEGMGTSPLAKTWEDRADTFINELRASDITSGYPAEVEKNPWLLKVPPETRVYDMLRGADEDLGFAHLADELKNAINPASGLPENLLWKYQDLEKVTVPQAVERVAEINAWRAAQKAEADMARAMGPATQVVKEYPEQGFKWVELRKPENTGKKSTVERSELDELGMGVDDATLREVAEEMAYDEGLEEGTRAFDDFVNQTIRAHNTKTPVEVDESVKALEDALKYEGDTMGHCVGGYCPDVAEGRSRIYSLRDKKGQPHVTIEVAPGKVHSTGGVDSLPESDYDRVVALADELSEKRLPGGVTTAEDIEAAYLKLFPPPLPEIVQIKGKGNRAPNPEYLPAVQDFIKSGNWGRIGDLQNTGLRRTSDVFNEAEQAFLKSKGVNLKPYIEPEETARYQELFKRSPDSEPGFAQGGVVRSLEDLHQRYAEGGEVGGANFPTDDFDPARIDAIVEELHALNAG